MISKLDHHKIGEHAINVPLSLLNKTWSTFIGNLDGNVDGWMDEWMAGWLDGRTDGRTLRWTGEH